MSSSRRDATSIIDGLSARSSSSAPWSNRESQARIQGEKAEAGGGAAPAQEPLRTPGRPLDAAARTFMEPRFAHSFGDVRIHTNTQASASARAFGAAAYTVGRDIAFDSGRYAPDTASGRRLLAHELAHVVQQEGQTPIAGQVALGDPGDRAERIADAAAQTVTRAPATPSNALQLRNHLRNARPARPTIQRAIKTWAGEWSTDKYNTAKHKYTTKDKYNTTKTGTQKDGVEIELRFKPGDPVDATKIGLVQMVTSWDKGGAVFPGGPKGVVASRSLPAKKSGEGANIDRLASERNPLYGTFATGPVAGAEDKLWDTPEAAASGQHGFHHIDKAGVLHKKDAILKDRPSIPNRGANASQIFETTALAVTGVQTGAYYGSVKWGWETNDTGTFKKIELARASNDVPSPLFARAQAKWNTSKDAAGNPLIKFYTATARFVNAPDTPLVTDPKDPAGSEIAKLPQNTRLEVINKGLFEPFNKLDPKVKWWKVTPVEGIAIGKVGWMMSSLLSAKKVGAPP